MKFKGAVFDMDGTLLDSMHVWDQIDVDFLAARGIPLPDDYREAVNKMRSYDIAVYTIKRFHLKEKPEDLVQEWIDMAIDAYSHTLPLKDGVYEYVSALHDAGVKMAVATASDRELVYPALERTGILPLMDRVVLANEVKNDKGSPDIYLKAAADLGVSPAECVVYEDIIEGIRGANAGGFTTVGICNPGAERTQEIQTEADRCIRSFRELMDDPFYGP